MHNVFGGGLQLCLGSYNIAHSRATNRIDNNRVIRWRVVHGCFAEEQCQSAQSFWRGLFVAVEQRWRERLLTSQNSAGGLEFNSFKGRFAYQLSEGRVDPSSITTASAGSNRISAATGLGSQISLSSHSHRWLCQRASSARLHPVITKASPCWR